jgi:ankyrin repeat protein
LLFAAEKNCVGVVEDMTQEGNSTTAAAVLKRASASGAVDVLKLVINYPEVGFNAKAEALFDAIENKQEKMVVLLLKNGADIDARKELTGTTPLMLATRLMDTKMIKLLVESGADVSIAKQADKTGVHVTATWLALTADQSEIVMLLLKQRGPDAKKQALLDAALQNAEKTFTALLKAGVDINTANDKGTTALTFAAKEGHLNLVKEVCRKR